MHLVKGSPTSGAGQLQMGLWFTTAQRAPSPHVPGHGSTQCMLMHACTCEHSAETTHSGRQPGGAPTYPGRHEHTAWPPWARHALLGPQGDGRHGSLSTGAR